MYLWAKFPLDTGSNLNVRTSSECLMNVTKPKNALKTSYRLDLTSSVALEVS